jgi:hypothetical protein
MKVVFRWLLLAEKMNLVMVPGMLNTLGGVYIVNREYRQSAQNLKP